MNQILNRLLSTTFSRSCLSWGKGFAFVARQKRLQYEDEFFYADLVFYNCILKCYLLIDLKIGKLTHQDVDLVNPDWAVLVEKDGGERLYFVVETKSGLFADELRYREKAKIECGKAHFSALSVGESPAQYIIAKDSNDLLA